MLSNLRSRLALSHALPLLIIVPLMGMALVYALDTQLLLPSLAREVNDQASLVADMVSDHPTVWNDAAQARAFVNRVGPQVAERIMLLDTQGRMLASKDPADAGQVGQPASSSIPAGVLAGKSSVRTTYSQRLQSEIVDAWIPVLNSDRQVIGIVRLTNRLASVYEQFTRLRYIIAGVSVAGLALSALVGWVLALDLAQPLQQTTRSISRLATGKQSAPLSEKGLEEIRLLTHAFNTLVERLHTLEQNRRHLLGYIVHELGRPLGALHSAIQALMGGADKDETLRRELLAGMDDEVKRLRRLVDDLAQLHDQVAGAWQIVSRPIALSDWLPHVLEPRHAAAQDKSLHWQVAIPADLPTMEVDPDRLGQAVGNLVNNAIKYTPPGGTISVNAGVMDSQVWIRVSDTGPGIPLQEQAHIFEPFYRGSTGFHSEGTGLGLSIARDLVAAHGGRLEVKSALGQGSQFTLWLPLGQLPKASSSPPRAQTNHASSLCVAHG